MGDIRETGVKGLKFGEGTLNNSPDLDFDELMSNIQAYKQASTRQLSEMFKPTYSEPMGIKLAQSGYGESTYDENAISDWDLNNLNEVRAVNQPGILQLGNGVLKMISTGVTTFLDSTVGALYGLGLGIANAVDNDESTSFIQGLWDNDFNRAMTSIQDSMEELLPNYYSQDELSSPWYTNILSANFIGDKVLKNMGFTIGALGAMALTAGIGGAVGKGALAASKFVLGNVGKAIGASRGTLAGINNFARGAGQFSNWLVNTAISANGEAAIEAINALKEGLKDAYANLESRRQELINSLDPDSPDYYSQLNAIDLASLEYKDEIDKQFTDAGNSVYLANLAILGTSNTLEFGHILKGGFGKSAKLANYELRANGEKVALADWVKAGIRGEKIGIENTVNKGLGRIAGITAKNILTEGTEEATQNLASNTAKIYAKAKGNEFSENSILGARINPEVTDEITDYTKAFSKALYDNFGSPESPGWEEFFLGGLTGGMGFMSLGRVKQKDSEGNYVIDPKTQLIVTKIRPIWEGGFMQAKRQVQEEYEDNQRIVDAVNKRLQDPEFIKRFQHSVASQKFSEDMSAALERNDMVEFKNSDMGRITNDVFFFRDAGMIDEYKSLYKQMAQGIDDKTLEQLYTATADENGNTALALEDMENVRQEYQDKAKRTLDKIEMVQQYYDYVDLEYRDRSQLFKEELAYQYIRLDDTNRRIKQLKEKAPSEISATLAAIKSYVKNGNELDLSQYYSDNLTDLEKLDLERLERQKKQYEEKIKEYTKNPEKLDRDINFAFAMGEAKRASLDALSLIKQIKEAKSAKDVDRVIAFADESVREEVWKAAYQDGDNEVKEKIETAIETQNAFAKTKERLQKVFRGSPEVANEIEELMRNLYINNELNPEKIREAMKALQLGIEAENPDSLSQYTDAFDLIATNLFGEENKKSRDLMLNFLESSLEQLGNTLRELLKYKTARATAEKVQQQLQQQLQQLQTKKTLKQLAQAANDHLGKIQENKTLKKSINKGTHVAVKKFGKDKLNDIIDKAIAKGNFEGSETDVESILNTLSNVFQDKMGKERSDNGVQDTINRFSNSNINPYRKAVGLVLQNEYKPSAQPAQPAQLPLPQQPQPQLPQLPLKSLSPVIEIDVPTTTGETRKEKVQKITASELKKGDLVWYSGPESETPIGLDTISVILNGEVFGEKGSLSKAKALYKVVTPNATLNQPEIFKAPNKEAQTLLDKFYKKLGREPLTFSMDEQRQIALNMGKALSLVNNGLSVPEDLKAYEDIILANKTDNNLPSLSPNNEFVVGGDDELNGSWVSLYDVSEGNPLEKEHVANLASELSLIAHYGSIENAKKVQWIIDYLLKDIKDAPVYLITSVGETFPNGRPKTTIYNAIKVSDIRGDVRKKIAKSHGWIQEINGDDYLVIGILGVSGTNQMLKDNYDAIRADLDDLISNNGVTSGYFVSSNPNHVMQITDIGDGRFAMNHFELNEWNSDDIVELLTGPNKEISNPLYVDPKKGQLKFSIEYTEGSKFVNKSNKDVVRRGSANLQKGKMYVLVPTPNGAYYRFPIKEVTIDESKDYYKQNGSDNKLVKEIDRLIDRIIEKQEVKDIIALKNLLVLENEAEELSFLDIYFDNGEIRVEYVPRVNEAHNKRNKNTVFLNTGDKAAAKSLLSNIIYGQIRPFINVNLSNTSSWEGVKRLSEAGALRLKRPLAVFSFVGANYTVKPATNKKVSGQEEKRKKLNPIANEQQINYKGRTIFLRGDDFYENETLISDPKEIETLKDLAAINRGNYTGETLHKKKKNKLIPLQGTYYFIEKGGALTIYHKDNNGNFTKLTGTDAAEALSRRNNKTTTSKSATNLSSESGLVFSVETATPELEKAFLQLAGLTVQSGGQNVQSLTAKDIAEIVIKLLGVTATLQRSLDADWESVIKELLGIKVMPSMPVDEVDNIIYNIFNKYDVGKYWNNLDAYYDRMKISRSILRNAVIKNGSSNTTTNTIAAKSTEPRKQDAVKRAIYDLEQKKGVKVGDAVEINGNQLTLVSVEYDEGVANTPANDIYGYSDIGGTVVLRLSDGRNQPFSYGVTRFLNGANNKKINKQSQKPLKDLDNSNNSSTFVSRIKDSSDAEGQSLLDLLYEKIDAINSSLGTTIDADDLTMAQLVETYKDLLDIDLSALPSNITLDLLEDIINCKL